MTFSEPRCYVLRFPSANDERPRFHDPERRGGTAGCLEGGEQTLDAGIGGRDGVHVAVRLGAPRSQRAQIAGAPGWEGEQDVAGTIVPAAASGQSQIQRQRQPQNEVHRSDPDCRRRATFVDGTRPETRWAAAASCSRSARQAGRLQVSSQYFP